MLIMSDTPCVNEFERIPYLPSLGSISPERLANATGVLAQQLGTIPTLSDQESAQRFAGDIEPDIVVNYMGQNAANVLARFAVYENVRAQRFNDLLLAALSLHGNETVIDLGAGKGELSLEIAKKGHKGMIIAVDPFLGTDLEVHPHVLYATGVAEDIPIPDYHADIVMLMFAGYHIPQDKRLKVYDEMERVLTPGGKIIIATSGEQNKMGHRVLEKNIANRLGVVAPKKMNSSYTTEVARQELLSRFRYVYQYDQIAPIVFNPKKEGDSRLLFNSLMSMYDQFVPVPDREAFIGAVIDEIAQVILEAYKSPTKDYRDIAHRTLFFVSNERKINDLPPGFKRMKKVA
jgi:ubiquinone/menaquinone biosynthesis C-methylase UbiE